MTFEFTLRIDQRVEDEEAMENVYSRCQDASLLVEGDVTLVEFHRDAATLQDAIRSAIQDVNAAGLHVTSIELQPDQLSAQTA